MIKSFILCYYHIRNKLSVSQQKPEAFLFPNLQTHEKVQSLPKVQSKK